MRVKLAVVGFLLGSSALVLWLFANWYSYSMLDFACADGFEDACNGTKAREVALKAGAAVAAWAALALLIFKAWKRH